jgi:hypothetical protein
MQNMIELWIRSTDRAFRVVRAAHQKTEAIYADFLQLGHIYALESMQDMRKSQTMTLYCPSASNVIPIKKPTPGPNGGLKMSLNHKQEGDIEDGK